MMAKTEIVLAIFRPFSFFEIVFGNFSAFLFVLKLFWQIFVLFSFFEIVLAISPPFSFFKIVLANFRPLPFLAATLIWALSAHRLFCESRHFAKYFHQHFELHWHLSKRGKACKYFFLVFFYFFLTYRFWVWKSRKKVLLKVLKKVNLPKKVLKAYLFTQKSTQKSKFPQKSTQKS